MWQRADPSLEAPSAPPDVQLWALRQQRLLLLLRDRAAVAEAVLAPAHPPRRRWKVGPPLAAGRLLALYRQAQRRFHVAWPVLAAVNFVETGFNKLRNDSIAGAKGPMQFMPSTWRAYGLGGDVHDPRDAILGAANYLHAAGAPASYRRALYAYNPSSLYVDAVLRYARRMRSSLRAFLSYYSWSLFVRTPAGKLRRLTGPR